RAGLGTVAAALALALSAVAAVVLAGAPEPVAAVIPWAAPLGPDLALRADPLAVVLALLVSVVGVAVVVYARGYFHGEPGGGRLLTTLLVFAAAMQLLAVADDPWLLFVAWELTSVCSYLLVQHSRTPAAMRAATTALLVTGGGGLALLAGLLLAQQATGMVRLSELAGLRDALHASTLAVPALVLLVVGCATKSALFPFHFWLPGAMAAPTPISAYLHAATMVKAGIFLLARLHPGFGGTVWWEALVGGLGAATVLAACLRLPGAEDLKQMLAWSTVLALGTLAVLLSLDSREAALAAVVLLVAHAGYKGTLFLTVGAIDHGTGTRLLPQLGGLARAMPWTAAAGLLGAASMMGLPPFAGFVAKEQVALAAAGWLPSAAVALAAVMLVAVAWWTGAQPFLGRVRGGGHPHDPPATMAAPLLALGLAGLAVGVGGPWWLAPLLGRAAEGIAGAAVVPGWSPVPGAWGAAGGAAAVVALGLAVAWQRPRLARWLGRLPTDLCARLWDAGLHGLIALGRACVHVTQHGDLRGYLAVTVLAAAALAAPGLAAVAWPAAGAVPSLAMVIVSLLLLVGALVAATARTRLAAVAGLGAVGYGMALLFITNGAPDLALTQILVETLVVVLLVLAFRHLPDLKPAPAAAGRRTATAVTAVVAGVFAGGLVLAAKGAQEGAPVGPSLIAAAWERGLGANAVNVILVDIRALDTLGEITVLLIAAVGVAALVLPAMKPGPLLARSPILAGASRFILPVAALLALFLWYRGHHQPGGGFAAGLCLGAGVVLLAAARGGAAARRALRLPPLAWAGGGLAIALAAGLVGVVNGGGFLAPVWAGPVGTPILFDLGVFALVVGITIMAVERLLEAEEGER
ncbi:MAG: hypothetical protein RLZZ127_3074, partial [Planctomycetota bacterium]